MKKVSLNEIEIEVQPELAEVVLRKKLSKEYFCWLIVKKLDETMGNSSGKIDKKKMIQKLIQITDMSRHSIARYLKNGDSIFWRFNKDQSVVYLNSLTKVCLSLELFHIYSYNVIYKLSSIEDNFGTYGKSLLISAVASKTGKPVSNIGLAERCGVCKRTVQNHLHKSVHELDVAHKIENFQLLSVHYNVKTAKESIPFSLKVNGYIDGSIRIKRYNNTYWLLKQLPNSIINKTGRTKIKQEKSKLRKSAGKPYIDKNNKIYIKSGERDTGLEYICTLSEDENTLDTKGIPNINIFIERRSIK